MVIFLKPTDHDSALRCVFLSLPCLALCQRYASVTFEQIILTPSDLYTKYSKDLYYTTSALLLHLTSWHRKTESSVLAFCFVL